MGAHDAVIILVQVSLQLSSGVTVVELPVVH